jgi:intracellular sulfur oxidation DsrE/DsrF family protein
LVGGFLSLGSASSSAEEAGKPAASARPLKIVLHVSDADGWAAAFSNLKNLTAQRPDAKLRVIVDGSGVYIMQGSTDMSPLFQKYSGLGVEFQACHNALTEKHISPTSLPSFVQVVPAAVVALAESQYSGYAYVKP